jgi:hypothetical protein
METPINFGSFNILRKSKSKKFVKKLFEEAFRLRKTFKSFKTSNKSPLLEIASEMLEINQLKTQELIINLSKLIHKATLCKFKEL